MFTSGSLFKNLETIFFVFRYSGIQSISLTTKKGVTTAEPSKKDIYYTIFYFVTYCSISVYGVVRVKNDTSNFNVVPKVFVEAECIIMILLKLLTVLLAFVLRKRYSQSLNIMSYIDVGFEKAGVTIDYSVTFRWELLILFGKIDTLV